LRLVLILTVHITDTQRVATLTIVCEKLKRKNLFTSTSWLA